MTWRHKTSSSCNIVVNYTLHKWVLPPQELTDYNYSEKKRGHGWLTLNWSSDTISQFQSASIINPNTLPQRINLITLLDSLSHFV